MSGRYALLSTSNKERLVPFAKVLAGAGFTLLSTGGTARTLEEAGLSVTPVASHTGAAEMMGGRVKTLHPTIHGGILGDRVKHAAEAEAHSIAWIDVVVVNLYPFEAVVEAGADFSSAVENIDIGGPTMVRAAAKNHKHVLVVVDPEDYDRVGTAVASGTVDLALRRELALKAFHHTSRYDSVIADWMARATEKQNEFPPERALGLRRQQSLRYGENPHQAAAFYVDGDRTGRSLARMVQHQGKHLSFNNLADLDGAVRVVFEHQTPAAAVIKHMNPAGCATGDHLPQVFEAALAGDPVSAFGGIVAFNREVDGETVKAIRSSRTFFEVVVAPGFTTEALEKLAPREKLRVIELPRDWAQTRPPGRDARRVQGGWLIQDWDLIEGDVEWKVVTDRSPSTEEARALRFAWATCRGVKSNAIVLARTTPSGAALNGVGAGQMSRVDAVRIAVSKATHPLTNGVLASDAFFPFPDGLKVAAEAGIRAVIQPGGSVKDPEVIAAANEAGMAMVFTGTRHFRH